MVVLFEIDIDIVEASGENMSPIKLVKDLHASSSKSNFDRFEAVLLYVFLNVSFCYGRLSVVS